MKIQILQDFPLKCILLFPIVQLKRDTLIQIFTSHLRQNFVLHFTCSGRRSIYRTGSETCTKKLYGDREQRADDGKMLAGSWRSPLRPVISRLVKAAPSSPLSSSLFGCFFAPGSPTDDRWSEGDRARSTRPDIIALLLIDFCRVAFCANPTAAALVSPRPTSLHPETGVTTINSRNRSDDYTPYEYTSLFASHCVTACDLMKCTNNQVTRACFLKERDHV